MMKVTYLGHASFKVESDGKTVYVDPWLNGPTSPIKVNDVKKADIVLVTHDHGDHGYQEAIEICKKTSAYFIAINELAIQAKSEGLDNVHTLNIGGSVNVGGIEVTLVQAFHSCGTGAPTGFIVKFPSDSFYHPGDTGLFATMELFGELYQPDVFMVPIGSYYTSDVRQAALATKLVKPKVVIPMHYNTFPVIEADPEKFRDAVGETAPEVKVEILVPGFSKDLEF
ncbi:metal-dependent hydrolase [Candidatus Thorarchaeota archaeon]|nr:MAG: metal-dependent hydrolase [Candidatus Thorarchaeota archaeon]